tara:strand:+ start:128 stop:346 length:219 start_codon:yes stop_codon:yes gene_type:complete
MKDLKVFQGPSAVDSFIGNALELMVGPLAAGMTEEQLDEALLSALKDIISGDGETSAMLPGNIQAPVNLRNN